MSDDESPFGAPARPPAVCVCGAELGPCEIHDVPKRPRRSRRSARAAGSRFERIVADYLSGEVDDRIDRRVKTGSADKGDIGGVRFDGDRVVIEAKDTSTMSLPAWLREVEVERENDGAHFGVVVHKRRGTSDPGEQYVTMTLDTFAAFLRRG